MSKMNNLLNEVNMNVNHLNHSEQTQNNDVTVLLNRFNRNMLSSIIETSSEKRETFIQGKKLLIKEAINLLTVRFSDLNELILYLQLKYVRLSKTARVWKVLHMKDATELIKPTSTPEAISCAISKYYKKNGVICEVYSEKEGSCIWSVLLFSDSGPRKPVYITVNMKLSLVLISSCVVPKYNKAILNKVIKKTYNASDIEELPDLKADTEYIQNLNIKNFNKALNLNKALKTKPVSVEKDKEARTNAVIEKEGEKTKTNASKREELEKKRILEKRKTRANVITEKEVKEAKRTASEKEKFGKTKTLQKKDVKQAKKNVQNRIEEEKITRAASRRRDGRRTIIVAEKEVDVKVTPSKKEKTKMVRKKDTVKPKKNIVYRKDEEIRTKIVSENNKEMRTEKKKAKISACEKERLELGKKEFIQANEKIVKNGKDEMRTCVVLLEKIDARANAVVEEKSEDTKAKVSGRTRHEKAGTNVIKRAKETKLKNVLHEKKVLKDKAEGSMQRCAAKRQIQENPSEAVDNECKKTKYDHITFETRDLPTVTSLNYCVKSDIFATKENINSVCVVEFQGTNILKGLEKLVEKGMADNQLPSYLYNEPRSGKTDFMIKL